MVSGILFFSFPAKAAVNADSTRIVFNATQDSVPLGLANSEQAPALVQIWADRGDPRVPPNQITTPIIAIPPLFKMAPGEIRSVKLLLSGRDKLPADRESVYWLNIYQIPPLKRADEQEKQKVILPLRLRLKVFVRPKGIAAPQENVGEKLTFFHVKQDGAAALRIVNPTPWHLTVMQITCRGAFVQPQMVAPRAEMTALWQGNPGNCQNITYSLINDNGTYWRYSGTVKG